MESLENGQKARKDVRMDRSQLQAMKGDALRKYARSVGVRPHDMVDGKPKFLSKARLIERILNFTPKPGRPTSKVNVKPTEPVASQPEPKPTVIANPKYKPGASKIEGAFTDFIMGTLAQHGAEVLAQCESAVQKAVQDAMEAITPPARQIELTQDRVVVKTVKDAAHEHLGDMMVDALRGHHMLMVGPTQCGKTYIAEQLARELGWEFGSLSTCITTPESAFFGKGLPTLQGESLFQSTEFIRLAESEKDAIFLIDEADAMDPAIFLRLCSLLANGFSDVPNRAKNPKLQVRGKFVVVCAMNTPGTGATLNHSGRERQDGAVLERFTNFTYMFDYSEKVERAIAESYGSMEAYTLTQKLRKAKDKAGIDRVVSTRSTKIWAEYLSSGEWDEAKCIERFTATWTEDEKRRLKQAI
jgi:MoxR-like ATPase